MDPMSKAVTSVFVYFKAQNRIQYTAVQKIAYTSEITIFTLYFLGFRG